MKIAYDDPRMIQQFYDGEQLQAQSGDGIRWDIGYTGTAAQLVRSITLGLSRIPRFVGQTSYGNVFSVLRHSLLVANICGDCSDLVRVHALLHDAHEVVTGDIPTPVKRHIGPAIADFQRRIDRCFFRTLKVPIPTELEEREIKKADLAALAAETLLFRNGIYGDNDEDVVCQNINELSVQEAVEFYVNALSSSLRRVRR